MILFFELLIWLSDPRLLLIYFVTSENQARLIQLEDAAKAAAKGKWGSPEELAAHVRDIKWQVDNPRHFVEANKSKEIEGNCDATLLYACDG